MAVMTQSPDLFELTFEDTKITYAPDAFGGSPRLHYIGPFGQHSFEGDEIQAMRSARGQEISVTLDSVSRFNTIKLTLFVPDMELDASSELSFRTIGIHSTRTHDTPGATREATRSERLDVNGLAKLIQFPPLQPAVLL